MKQISSIHTFSEPAESRLASWGCWSLFQRLLDAGRVNPGQAASLLQSQILTTQEPLRTFNQLWSIFLNDGKKPEFLEKILPVLLTTTPLLSSANMYFYSLIKNKQYPFWSPLSMLTFVSADLFIHTLHCGDCCSFVVPDDAQSRSTCRVANSHQAVLSCWHDHMTWWRSKDGENLYLLLNCWSWH